MDRESRKFAWLLGAIYLLSISILSARGAEIDPGFFTLTDTSEIGRHKDLYIYAISSEYTNADGTIEFNKTGGLPSDILKTGEFTPSGSPFLGCYLKVGQSERYGSYRYGEYSASFIFNDDILTPLMSPAFVKPKTEWLNTDGVYTVTIYPAEVDGTDLPCPEDIGVRYTPGCRKIVWCKDKRRNVNMGPRLKLTKTTQAGLYTIFRPTRKTRGWFVQILVIAASCPKNQYHDGSACIDVNVIDCKNGGVLKDKSNVCTCPPFFSGDDCGYAAPAFPDCGVGWVSWGGYCYQVLSSPQIWDDAQASCTSTDPPSNLASIRCQAEQDFIEGLIDGLNNDPYWIGLNDPGADNDVLEYVDGTEYTAGESYSNFPNGQPNESGNCVEFQGDGDWDDISCSSVPHTGICKRPAGEVIPGPDPISFALVKDGDNEIRCRDLPPCTNVKCRGILVCHNDNYGCKCSSGWWGNACDRPCQPGRYGPNCEEYCPPNESHCNRFYGPSCNLDSCGFGTD